MSAALLAEFHVLRRLGLITETMLARARHFLRKPRAASLEHLPLEQALDQLLEICR